MIMIEKINNNWLFIPNFKKEYINKVPNDVIEIALPHTVKEVNYSYFNEQKYQFISTYFKNIKIQNFLSETHYFLKFDAFMLKAKIYLNGSLLGDFISGYLPVQVEITKFLKNGDNLLVVVLDSREDKLIPPFGFVVDYLTYGGIYRDVFLIQKPKVYFSDIFVHGSMDGSLKISKNICGNPSNLLKVDYKLYYEEKIVKTFNNDFIKIENVNLWDVDNPNLYLLKAHLKDGNIEDEVEIKFGFKDAVFKKDGFYLNNKKIKLLGLNRHQSYPYFGYAAPNSLQEEDAEILRYEIGVNAVRSSHYPPSDYFLRKCDEIGLLVFDEVPGWQHIGKEETWRSNFLDFIKRMVLKDRNFTSIIAYGVRIDESKDDHELYLKANEIAHNLDPFKQTTGVRNFKNSECLEDIYSYNDFSCTDEEHGLVDPKTIYKGESPYVVTECMGHTKPTKTYDTEDYLVKTTLRYARIIDDTFKFNNLCGTFFWCAFDYNTHKDFGSGDHICHHGVYDMFRNPKMPSAILKAQGIKKPYMEVLGNQNIGDYQGAIYGYIYIATNLDYVDFYVNNELINRFYPDKKDYPNTPHPLIKIDDLVGDRIKGDFKKSEIKLIKDCFNYIAFNNFNKLPLKYLIKMSKVLIKTKKSVSYFIDLYTKIIQNWGSASTGFTFKGYKNDALVLTKSLGPSMKFKLTYNLTKKSLKHKVNDFDATRLIIKYLDQNESLMNYSFLPLKIETNENIEIMGPNLISLEAGQTSIYIKSVKKGIGEIKITSNLETKIIKIKVE